MVYILTLLRDDFHNFSGPLPPLYILYTKTMSEIHKNLACDFQRVTVSF